MEPQLSAAHLFVVTTINGRRPFTHLLIAPQTLRTIIIILRNIINSSGLWTLGITFIIIVAAPSHPRTDVCKRAYHLPFKRPTRWWMERTTKAIKINWIPSIILSEAPQGDVLKRSPNLLRNCSFLSSLSSLPSSPDVTCINSNISILILPRHTRMAWTPEAGVFQKVWPGRTVTFIGTTIEVLGRLSIDPRRDNRFK